jgi:hypothetical protein
VKAQEQTNPNAGEIWLNRWKNFVLQYDLLYKTGDQGRIALARQCAAYSHRLFVARLDREAIPAAQFARMAAPDLPEVLIVHGAACYLRRQLNPELLREAQEVWEVAARSDSEVSELAGHLLTIISKDEPDPFGKFLMIQGMPYPLHDFTLQLV